MASHGDRVAVTRDAGARAGTVTASLTETGGLGRGGALGHCDSVTRAGPARVAPWRVTGSTGTGTETSMHWP